MSRRVLLPIMIALALFVCSAIPARAQVVVHWLYPASKAALSESWIKAYNDARAGRVVIEGTAVPLYRLQDTFSQPGEVLPDAVFAPSDWAGQLVNERLLTQLDSRISPDFRAQITNIGWRTATYDSRLIGVPILLEGYALYYNKALLWDIPLPTTLEELTRAAAQIHERGQGELTGLSLVLDYFPTGGLLSALGETPITEIGQNRLGIGTASSTYLTSLAGLAKSKGVVVNQSDAAFREGRAAFLVGGSWSLQEYRALLGSDLGVAPLPGVNDKPWHPLVRSWVIYARLGSPNIDAVLDFARFLSEPAPQTLALDAGEIPVNPTTFEADPLAGAFARLFAEQGEPLPNRVEFSAYWIPLNRAIQDVLNGNSTPEAAAAAAVEQIESILAGGR